MRPFPHQSLSNDHTEVLWLIRFNIASPELYSAWTEALNEVVLYKATTQREFTGINVTRYCGLGSYVVRLKNHGDYHGYTQTQWWKDVVSKAPVLTDK